MIECQITKLRYNIKSSCFRVAYRFMWIVIILFQLVSFCPTYSSMQPVQIMQETNLLKVQSNLYFILNCFFNKFCSIIYILTSVWLLVKFASARILFIFGACLLLLIHIVFSTIIVIHGRKAIVSVVPYSLCFYTPHVYFLCLFFYIIYCFFIVSAVKTLCQLL